MQKTIFIGIFLKYGLEEIEVTLIPFIDELHLWGLR